MNQEKRNKILTASLALLSLLAMVLFYYPRDRQEVDKNIFRVKDLPSVDRVVLSSPAGQIELRYNGVRIDYDGLFEIACRNI